MQCYRLDLIDLISVLCQIVMKVSLVCLSVMVHQPLQEGYRQGMFEMLLKQVESPDDETYQVFLDTVLQSHKQYNHNLV